MPLCKSCGQHANVLTIDPCPNCNAKNWDEDTVLKPVPGESLHDRTMREHGERYAKMTPAQRAAASKPYAQRTTVQRAADSLGCLGGIFGVALAIAVALGGLWLLIAIVKWMWQHS